MQEPEEILEIFNKRAQVIKPGLGRVAAAWKALGYPGRNIPTVLVAGTNGKGSTSGILWHLLSTLGLHVGLFTSPHLIEFRERISTSQADVSNSLLTEFIHRIKNSLGAVMWEDLTFFEINTLLALTVFESLKVDYIVLEVGLGGRLDSTNIVNPCLSIITSIGLDHTEYLGNDLLSIAKEKCGIMRPNSVCVWGGQTNHDASVNQFIRKYAHDLQTTLKISGWDFSDGDSQRLSIRGFGDWDWPKYTVQAKWPKFLRQNFAAAFAGLWEIVKDSPSAQNQLQHALSEFGSKKHKWPVTLKGRFNCLTMSKDKTSRPVILDVCHNVQGANALRSALVEMNIATESRPVPALLCILNDKDASGIWDSLKGCVSQAMLFKISSPRSWTKENAVLPFEMHNSFKEAWIHALSKRDWTDDPERPWLITGSVAAIGEVFHFFESNGWTPRDPMGSVS